MNHKDIPIKLKWWVKEHLLFYKNYSIDEMFLEYKLPPEYGDFAIHPCVRMDSRGRWWMTLTPYPGFNDKMENILLFQGETIGPEVPGKWKFVKEVCGSHPRGYNSDPNLFLAGEDKLWLLWREFDTENLPLGVKNTCIVKIEIDCAGDEVKFSESTVVATNVFNTYNCMGDTVMCPTVIRYKGEIRMYSSCYQFRPRIRPIGVSQYLYDGREFHPDGMYVLPDTSFDLWHFDMFVLDGVLYQIITPNMGNAIYVGASTDGYNFKYYKRPVFNNVWFVRKNFYYKPSAQVVGDKIYIFFPKKVGDGNLRIACRTIYVDRYRSLYGLQKKDCNS